MKKILLFKN